MRKLQPSTLATIDHFRTFAWFSQLGKPIESSRPVKNVVTISEALKYLSQKGWENLKYEAAGDYSTRLMKNSRKLYREWNSRVDLVKPFAESITKEALTQSNFDDSTRRAIEDDLKWDILHVLLEAEYSEYVEPGFFSFLAYWYSTGHLPCGWIGKYPEGELVVF